MFPATGRRSGTLSLKTLYSARAGIRCARSRVIRGKASSEVRVTSSCVSASLFRPAAKLLMHEMAPTFKPSPFATMASGVRRHTHGVCT